MSHTEYERSFPEAEAEAETLVNIENSIRSSKENITIGSIVAGFGVPASIVFAKYFFDAQASGIGVEVVGLTTIAAEAGLAVYAAVMAVYGVRRIVINHAELVGATTAKMLLISRNLIETARKP